MVAVGALAVGAVGTTAPPKVVIPAAPTSYRLIRLVAVGALGGAAVPAAPTSYRLIGFIAIGAVAIGAVAIGEVAIGEVAVGEVGTTAPPKVAVTTIQTS